MSYNKIGDVQVAQGDLAGALKSFSDSLAIADRLAQSDPGNAGWRRDLSVSYEKIGDVQVAQGDLAGALKSFSDSLAIRDRLAQSDPGNAGWRRDLSVSYEKIGDVQVAQGDLAGALKSFSDSLAIRDRLAQSDPGNAGWRRDLAVSYAKIGDALGRMGDGARALEALRRGQAIMVGLTALSPDNAQWKRDLDWFEEPDRRALAIGRAPTPLPLTRMRVTRGVGRPGARVRRLGPPKPRRPLYAALSRNPPEVPRNQGIDIFLYKTEPRVMVSIRRIERLRLLLEARVWKTFWPCPSSPTWRENFCLNRP